MSWCGNFVERYSFRIFSSYSPKTMRKLCFCTKFPRHEIRWNYGILRSERNAEKKGFSMNYFGSITEWSDAVHVMKYLHLYFLEFSWHHGFKISLNVFSINTMCSITYFIYTAKIKMHTHYLWHYVLFYTVKNFMKNFTLIIIPLVNS